MKKLFSNMLASGSSSCYQLPSTAFVGIITFGSMVIESVFGLPGLAATCQWALNEIILHLAYY